MATTGPVAMPLIPDLSGVVTADTAGGDTGPQEGENTYRWATVTAVTPLRIQLDGDTLALPITPESLADPDTLRLGLRVWVQLFGRRVIVLGTSQGGADVLVPIGGMVPYAGAAAPNVNFKLADGAAVSRTIYAALFAVCGTTYGAGDGSTTFNLPNLTNRVPAGSGGTFARGATGGAQTVVLTDANLSSHTHSFSGSLSGSSLSASTGSVGDHGHSISGGTDSVGNHSHFAENQSTRSDILAGGGTTVAATGGSTGGGAGGHSHGISASIGSGGSHSHSVSGSASGTVSGTSGTTGSDTAHENMPPYLAVPYLIRVL